MLLTNKRQDYIQSISLLDKNLNMITLWSLEKFDHKLNILRDIYARVIDEEELVHTSSASEFQSLIFESNEEWQTVEKFEQNDSNFSPRMYFNFFLIFKNIYNQKNV